MDSLSRDDIDSMRYNDISFLLSTAVRPYLRRAVNGSQYGFMEDTIFFP